MGCGRDDGSFYNEYPPATSCLRSMAFGRIAGLEIAQNLGKQQGTASRNGVVPVQHEPDALSMKQDVLVGEAKS